MFPAIDESHSTSQAADLHKAEAARKIHADCATASAASGEAQVGVCQGPLPQGVPCTSQLLVFGALADAIGDDVCDVFLLKMTIAIMSHGRP